MAYELVIERSNSWFRLNLRELLHYGDLLFLFVRRDLVSRYKQTILGPAWFVIQPLLMTLMFTVIFGKIAKIPTDELPPMLFYMCGMLAWSYFAQCLGGTSTTFLSNSGLFAKVYFPRLIIPLSVTISNLIAFAIQLATFMCFWIYFKFFTAAGAHFHVTDALLALPVLLAISGLAGLGVGLWMSALTAKYRDFSHLAGILTQLWFYATPVVYPTSLVLSKLEARGLGHWGWVMALNPMAGILEAYRYAFLGAGMVRPLYLAVSAAMTLFLLVTGVLVFARTERNFVDTV
jgi:lipopolysaccharide transport system permease protein